MLAIMDILLPMDFKGIKLIDFKKTEEMNPSNRLEAAETEAYRSKISGLGMGDI